jgi:hypothetical protein
MIHAVGILNDIIVVLMLLIAAFLLVSIVLRGVRK